MNTPLGPPPLTDTVQVLQRGARPPVTVDTWTQIQYYYQTQLTYRSKALNGGRHSSDDQFVAVVNQHEHVALVAHSYLLSASWSAGDTEGAESVSGNVSCSPQTLRYVRAHLDTIVHG